MNLIEKLSADLRDAQADIQRLRDENNRLKGEQGKPRINPNVANPPADHSSENERHKPRQRSKGSKNANIPIDREQVVKVDQANLPADAEFKGYEDMVVQDIRLRTDNVRFRKEKYYAVSTRKTRYAWPNCRVGTQVSLGLGSRR